MLVHLLGRLADAMVRRGNQRIKLEHLQEQPPLAFADVEDKVFPLLFDKLHASRSMVACRL